MRRAHLLLVALLVLTLPWSADAQPGATHRASVTSDGGEPTGESDASAISPDGRFVAFVSSAKNLVPNKSTSRYEVFVRDLYLGTTARASVSTSSGDPNADCQGPVAISAGGRYVSFACGATNLVKNDTSIYGLFVRDLLAGRTFPANVASLELCWPNCPPGAGAPNQGYIYWSAMSGDGRYVAFISSATNLVLGGGAGGIHDVFVHDNFGGSTKLVSVDAQGEHANDDCYQVSISDDGKRVAFSCGASNLVPGDTNNGADVFVRDLAYNTITRVSVSSVNHCWPNCPADTGQIASASEPAISRDGRYVAFTSSASNVVPDDTNSTFDVFVHDLEAHVTTRASVGSAGQQANLDSSQPSLGGQGRFVAFYSRASNLVDGDTNNGYDIFVRDFLKGTTERVSVASQVACWPTCPPGTGQANGNSLRPTISASGASVSFTSMANNLVAGDAAGFTEIFVHQRAGQGTASGKPSFDADLIADLAVFRPTTGEWFVKTSSSLFTEQSSRKFGALGDQPLAGDFDGDNIRDLTVYRPSTGTWFWLKSGTGNASHAWVGWGVQAQGDTPAPGDYDGDGMTDPTVFRPQHGTWFVLPSSTSFTKYRAIGWGQTGDQPVPADYDGDGSSDIAIYRPTTGQWFILPSTSNFTSGWAPIAFGQGNDTPLAGDFDGDGRADIAVYRPSTGTWFWLKSSTNWTAMQYVGWGMQAHNDTPVPGDFDGDGRTDPTVYRPATGTWFILESSSGHTTWSAHGWGMPGDVPVGQHR